MPSTICTASTSAIICVCALCWETISLHLIYACAMASKITNPQLAEHAAPTPSPTHWRSRRHCHSLLTTDAPYPSTRIAYFTIMFKWDSSCSDAFPIRAVCSWFVRRVNRARAFLLISLKRHSAIPSASSPSAASLSSTHIDLNTFDYIFSSVPIDRAVPKPIMQVNSFLEAHDMNRVRRRHELGDSSYLRRFYRPEFFFRASRRGVETTPLAELCELVRQVRPLPDNFLGSVLEREKHGSTDFVPGSSASSHRGASRREPRGRGCSQAPQSVGRPMTSNSSSLHRSATHPQTRLNDSIKRPHGFLPTRSGHAAS